MGTFGKPRGGRGGGYGRGESGGPLRPVFDDGGFGRHEKPDYKTAALCKQVRRVVGLALSGECADPVLQGLIVDEVLPAPNAGRLLVRVLMRTGADGPGVIDVLQRLAKVEGMLRASVGEAIARKRTPELAFDVVPMGLSEVLPDARAESLPEDCEQNGPCPRSGRASGEVTHE